MRFGLYIGVLASLLAFSTFMTLTTSGLLKVGNDKVNLYSVIPYDRMSPHQLASTVAEVLGDNITERINTFRLQGCVISSYSTVKGNRVQLGFCRGEFRFLSYANLAKTSIPDFTSDIPSSIARLLVRLTDDPHLVTDFVVESSEDRRGVKTIRGFQTYGGQRILASGFLVDWEDLEAVATSVIIFDIYRLPLIQPPLPQPRLEELMTTIRDSGFAGFTYRQPIVQGIKVCGERLTYSVRVVSEQSPLHGYEALVDAYSGEVVLLIGLSALGVYRLWEKTC